MKNNLDDVLMMIGKEYENNILKGSRNYLEVDIGNKAAKMGYFGLKDKFANVYAIVPLKAPVAGMKVRIDGRTFVNYAQFDTGVAVPGNVAQNADLPYKEFVPNDSMILNFT